MDSKCYERTSLNTTVSFAKAGKIPENIVDSNGIRLPRITSFHCLYKGEITDGFLLLTSDNLDKKISECHTKGKLAFKQGLYESAIEFFSHPSMFYKENETNKQAMCCFKNNLGCAQSMLGNHVTGCVEQQEAIELGESSETLNNRLVMKSNLARILMNSENNREAEAILSELYEKLSNSEIVCGDVTVRSRDNQTSKAQPNGNEGGALSIFSKVSKYFFPDKKTVDKEQSFRIELDTMVVITLNYVRVLSKLDNHHRAVELLQGLMALVKFDINSSLAITIQSLLIVSHTHIGCMTEADKIYLQIRPEISLINRRLDDRRLQPSLFIIVQDITRAMVCIGVRKLAGNLLEKSVDVCTDMYGEDHCLTQRLVKTASELFPPIRHIWHDEIQINWDELIKLPLPIIIERYGSCQAGSPKVSGCQKRNERILEFLNGTESLLTSSPDLWMSSPKDAFFKSIAIVTSYDEKIAQDSIDECRQLLKEFTLTSSESIVVIVRLCIFMEAFLIVKATSSVSLICNTLVDLLTYIKNADKNRTETTIEIYNDCSGLVSFYVSYREVAIEGKQTKMCNVITCGRHPKDDVMDKDMEKPLFKTTTLDNSRLVVVQGPPGTEKSSVGKQLLSLLRPHLILDISELRKLDRSIVEIMNSSPHFPTSILVEFMAVNLVFSLVFSRIDLLRFCLYPEAITANPSVPVTEFYCYEYQRLLMFATKTAPALLAAALQHQLMRHVIAGEVYKSSKEDKLYLTDSRVLTLTTHEETLLLNLKFLRTNHVTGDVILDDIKDFCDDVIMKYSDFFDVTPLNVEEQWTRVKPGSESCADVVDTLEDKLTHALERNVHLMRENEYLQKRVLDLIDHCQQLQEDLTTLQTHPISSKAEESRDNLFDRDGSVTDKQDGVTTVTDSPLCSHEYEQTGSLSRTDTIDNDDQKRLKELGLLEFQRDKNERERKKYVNVAQEIAHFKKRNASQQLQHTASGTSSKDEASARSIDSNAGGYNGVLTQTPKKPRWDLNAKEQSAGASTRNESATSYRQPSGPYNGDLPSSKPGKHQDQFGLNKIPGKQVASTTQGSTNKQILVSKYEGLPLSKPDINQEKVGHDTSFGENVTGSTQGTNDPQGSTFLKDRASGSEEVVSKHERHLENVGCGTALAGQKGNGAIWTPVFYGIAQMGNKLKQMDTQPRTTNKWHNTEEVYCDGPPSRPEYFAAADDDDDDDDEEFDIDDANRVKSRQTCYGGGYSLVVGRDNIRSNGESHCFDMGYSGKSDGVSVNKDQDGSDANDKSEEFASKKEDDDNDSCDGDDNRDVNSKSEDDDDSYCGGDGSGGGDAGDGYDDDDDESDSDVDCYDADDDGNMDDNNGGGVGDIQDGYCRNETLATDSLPLQNMNTSNHNFPKQTTTRRSDGVDVDQSSSKITTMVSTKIPGEKVVSDGLPGSSKVAVREGRPNENKPLESNKANAEVFSGNVSGRALKNDLVNEWETTMNTNASIFDISKPRKKAEPEESDEEIYPDKEEVLEGAKAKTDGVESEKTVVVKRRKNKLSRPKTAAVESGPHERKAQEFDKTEANDSLKESTHDSQMNTHKYPLQVNISNQRKKKSRPEESDDESSRDESDVDYKRVREAAEVIMNGVALAKTAADNKTKESLARRNNKELSDDLDAAKAVIYSTTTDYIHPNLTHIYTETTPIKDASKQEEMISACSKSNEQIGKEPDGSKVMKFLVVQEKCSHSLRSLSADNDSANSKSHEAIVKENKPQSVPAMGLSGESSGASNKTRGNTDGDDKNDSSEIKNENIKPFLHFSATENPNSLTCAISLQDGNLGGSRVYSHDKDVNLQRSPQMSTTKKSIKYKEAHLDNVLTAKSCASSDVEDYQQQYTEDPNSANSKTRPSEKRQKQYNFDAENVDIMNDGGTAIINGLKATNINIRNSKGVTVVNGSDGTTMYSMESEPSKLNAALTQHYSLTDAQRTNSHHKEKVSEDDSQEDNLLASKLYELAYTRKLNEIVDGSTTHSHVSTSNGDLRDRTSHGEYDTRHSHKDFSSLPVLQRSNYVDVKQDNHKQRSVSYHTLNTVIENSERDGDDTLNMYLGHSDSHSEDCDDNGGFRPLGLNPAFISKHSMNFFPSCLRYLSLPCAPTSTADDSRNMYDSFSGRTNSPMPNTQRTMFVDTRTLGKTLNKETIEEEETFPYYPHGAKAPMIDNTQTVKGNSYNQIPAKSKHGKFTPFPLNSDDNPTVNSKRDGHLFLPLNELSKSSKNSYKQGNLTDFSRTCLHSSGTKHATRNLEFDENLAGSCTRDSALIDPAYSVGHSNCEHFASKSDELVPTHTHAPSTDSSFVSEEYASCTSEPEDEDVRTCTSSFSSTEPVTTVAMASDATSSKTLDFPDVMTVSTGTSLSGDESLSLRETKKAPAVEKKLSYLNDINTPVAKETKTLCESSSFSGQKPLSLMKTNSTAELKPLSLTSKDMVKSNVFETGESWDHQVPSKEICGKSQTALLGHEKCDSNPLDGKTSSIAIASAASNVVFCHGNTTAVMPSDSLLSKGQLNASNSFVTQGEVVSSDSAPSEIKSSSMPFVPFGLSRESQAHSHITSETVQSEELTKAQSEGNVSAAISAESEASLIQTEKHETVTDTSNEREEACGITHSPTRTGESCSRKTEFGALNTATSKGGEYHSTKSESLTSGNENEMLGSLANKGETNDRSLVETIDSRTLAQSKAVTSSASSEAETWSRKDDRSLVHKNQTSDSRTTARSEAVASCSLGESISTNKGAACGSLLNNFESTSSQSLPSKLHLSSTDDSGPIYKSTSDINQSLRTSSASVRDSSIANQPTTSFSASSEDTATSNNNDLSLRTTSKSVKDSSIANQPTTSFSASSEDTATSNNNDLSLRATSKSVKDSSIANQTTASFSASSEDTATSNNNDLRATSASVTDSSSLNQSTASFSASSEGAASASNASNNEALNDDFKSLEQTVNRYRETFSNLVVDSFYEMDHQRRRAVKADRERKRKKEMEEIEKMLEKRKQKEQEDSGTKPRPASLPVQESNDAKVSCVHFKRGCDTLFPCCNKFYQCHRCHNNSKHCEVTDAKALDATHLRCRTCMTVQEITPTSSSCSHCKRKLSEYFCGICKHYTADDKKPYHCEPCGICRVHRDNSFHCDVCNVCLNKKLEGKHKCRPDSGHDECCICLEDAFGGCQVLPCSHKVHRDCAVLMVKNGVRKCPICRAPIYQD